MDVHIPNRGALSIRHVVLDFNGTLAVDGVVEDTTTQLVQTLCAQYHVVLATADTFGTAGSFAGQLGIEWQRVQTGEDKKAIVQSLGAAVAAVGNGANDVPMFRAADLAIAVLGAEGLDVVAIREADVVAPSIERALELLLYPQRLVATLRG